MAKQKDTATKKKLGDLLTEVGIISKEQLGNALQDQKAKGIKLGESLISLGYITEDVLLAFLGKQCGVPYISLSEYGEISPDVIRSVPENVVRHQTLIPISKEGKILTIAMNDPLNVFATDDLRLMTGCEINPVIASEAEIKNAIEKYYSVKGSMDDIVKEMSTSEEDANLEVVKEDEESDDLSALAAAGEEAPIIRICNLLLSGAIRAKASDIHVEPYEKKLRVRYRIDGVLHEVNAPPKKLQNAIISRFKIMSSLNIAERRVPQDGRIKIKIMDREIDLRVSICPTAFGEKIVMRILDSSNLCLDLNKLGFEPETLAIFNKCIEAPYGIILVTGPTGSGKSTTLYSALSTLNFPDKNINTIEDPVEYVLAGINQVQVKPDIGFTFSAGLRSFLRQDPDIIMVGEIRDTETAEIAVNAALTGHLVLSTLHTNDAPGSVTRMLNMGVEPFLITSTVIMVVAQRLARVICKDCKEPYEISSEYLESIGVGKEMFDGKKKVNLYRGKGCDKCSNTGYKGRLACYEVMEMNDTIRKLILQSKPTLEIRKAAKKTGMITLRDAAVKKMLVGATTVEEVLRLTVEDEE